MAQTTISDCFIGNAQNSDKTNEPGVLGDLLSSNVLANLLVTLIIVNVEV